MFDNLKTYVMNFMARNIFLIQISIYLTLYQVELKFQRFNLQKDFAFIVRKMKFFFLEFFPGLISLYDGIYFNIKVVCTWEAYLNFPKFYNVVMRVEIHKFLMFPNRCLT